MNDKNDSFYMQVLKNKENKKKKRKKDLSIKLL